jgi:dTDP-4-dehydrorhamnose reductase
MKTMVWGNGFIANHLPYEKITNRILGAFNIERILLEHKPDVLINCIGYGGSINIDDCETNKFKTFETNTILPIILADICQARKIKLIHISSGCIFNGTSPNIQYPIPLVRDHYVLPTDGGWKETDAANPMSLYSKSKLASDLVLQNYSNAAILRIRMPISSKHHPRNLITKLINYKRVVEEENSITPLACLSRTIDFVIEKDLTGIYHIANPEPIKHSRLLEEYRKYVPTHQYEKISANELDKLTVAKRSNCILNSEKIMNAGFKFQPIDEVIGDYMKRYVEENK